MSAQALSQAVKLFFSCCEGYQPKDTLNMDKMTYFSGTALGKHWHKLYKLKTVPAFLTNLCKVDSPILTCVFTDIEISEKLNCQDTWMLCCLITENEQTFSKTCISLYFFKGETYSRGERSKESISITYRREVSQHTYTNLYMICSAVFFGMWLILTGYNQW